MRPEHLALHHLGKAQDGVERRAQLMAHLRQEARLGDVGALGAAPRFVGNRLGLLEFADQRVLLGAGLERRERRRVQPVRQHGEIGLRGQRHGRENVVVHAAAQREIERDRDRHRRGRGAHRHRQGRGQHARHRDDEQHDEQHEGRGAFVGAHHRDHVRHPGDAEEQVEDHEARAPARDIDPARGFGEELAALRRDDAVDAEHAERPGAGKRRPGPQAGQRADGCDQQQDRDRGGLAVLRELTQQLVVEGRRAAGGGELVAHPAHALVRVTPLRRGRALPRRGNAELPARHRGHGTSDIRKIPRVCAS